MLRASKSKACARRATSLIRQQSAGKAADTARPYRKVMRHAPRGYARKKSPACGGALFISNESKFCVASDLATASREAEAEQAEAEQAERRRFRHRAAAGLVAPRLEVRSAELEVAAGRADLHVQQAIADQ